MRYKLLGNSGLRVAELCLGTMTFGEDWGWGASKEESRRMFDAYVEAGGNFIDTAVNYTNGTSEKFVGEFVKSERHRFVVATKYSITTRKGDPNAAGNHRKNMIQSLERSLRQLDTDYIDLYWVHAWDFLTPVEEVMRALDDIVRQGKALYLGISDTPAWIVARANMLAELRGWTPFVGLQIEYSLIERTVERELVPMAHALGLALLAWAPLGGGVLTGKFSEGPTPSESTRLKPGSPRLSERNLSIAEMVVNVAKELDCTPAQVALAWLRQRPITVIPIIGARTVAQLKENLRSLQCRLDDEHRAKLDDASRVEPGFPHEFLQRAAIREILYSGTFDRIDFPKR